MTDHPDTMRVGAAWRGPTRFSDVRRLAAVFDDEEPVRLLWYRPVREVSQHAARSVTLRAWLDFVRTAERAPEHDLVNMAVAEAVG